MKKLKLIIKERRVYLPTFRFPMMRLGITFPFDFSYRMPSVEGLNFGSGVKKIIALGLGVSALTMGIAIVFSIKDIDPSPDWPAPAIYDAGQSQKFAMKTLGEGEKHKASSESPATQTLKLNIGGARIQSIVFTDVQVGRSGIDDAISISASSENIICEKLEIIDLEAPDFTLGTSTAYKLTVATTTTDGSSITSNLSSDPVDYSFGSNRGALNVPDVTGGSFDRIVIASSATSTVGLIKFERVHAHSAGVSLGNLHCGEIVIRGTGADKFRVGDGTGIDSASFRIGGDYGTLKVATVASVTNNVEKNLSVK